MSASPAFFCDWQAVAPFVAAQGRVTNNFLEIRLTLPHIAPGFAGGAAFGCGPNREVVWVAFLTCIFALFC